MNDTFQIGEIKTPSGSCLGHGETYLNVGPCDGSAGQRWQWGFTFETQL